MVDAWQEVAGRLVAERGEALTRYAYLLCGDADEASDLVQEALVRTFGTPRMTLTLPRAEAYVRRAILNQVIDRTRRQGTWRRVRHLAVPGDHRQAPARSARRLAVPDRLGELEAVQHRHVAVREDEGDPTAGQALQGLLAVAHDR